MNSDSVHQEVLAFVQVDSRVHGLEFFLGGLGTLCLGHYSYGARPGKPCAGGWPGLCNRWGSPHLLRVPGCGASAPPPGPYLWPSSASNRAWLTKPLCPLPSAGPLGRMRPPCAGEEIEAKGGIGAYKLGAKAN